MANDYFDILNQGSLLNKPEEPKNDGLVSITVRADAECQVVCDGEFWILLNANQVVKEKAPAGQHLLEFISIDYPDVRVEREVDWPDAGRNYLVVVKEFKQLIEANNSTAERAVEPATPHTKNALGNQNQEAPANLEQNRVIDFFGKYCDKNGSVNLEWGDFYWGSDLKDHPGFLKRQWSHDERTRLSELVLGEIQPAAESGIISAAFVMGHYFYLIEKKDEAERWYQVAAEKGYAPAQYALSVVHESDSDFYDDNAQFKRWARLAADQGYAPAQARLGRISADFCDEEQTLFWCNKAFNQDFLFAGCIVAYMYDDKMFQCHDKAYEWYLRTAERGHAGAQCVIGNFNQSGPLFGPGLPKDTSKAIDWYRKAAAQGYTDAVIGLGECYETQKNYHEAYKWYKEALKQGGSRWTSESQLGTKIAELEKML